METATRTLYVVCGLPFSGKTTYARTLLKEGDLLIERDAFLETINHEPETLKRLREEARQVRETLSRLASTVEANAFNDVLTKEYSRRVVQAIRSSLAETIVVDGTHLWPLSRSFVRDVPDRRCLAIVIEQDPEVCIQRFEQARLTGGVRSTITPDLIRRMSQVFECPTLEEGFAEVRHVRHTRS